MTAYPQDPVERQLDAYNRRDLEGFLSAYTPDVEMYGMPSGTLLMKGHEGARPYYGPMFANYTQLHCEILHRIRDGNMVIDHERLHHHPRGNGFEAVAIYQITDGLISRVWFLNR